MSLLLVVTAFAEVGAGLALLSCPSVAVALLLGSPLDTSVAITIERVAGTALLALGIACWLARGDSGARSQRGLVCGMLVYNLGVCLWLAFAGSVMRISGVALWPAVCTSRGADDLVRGESSSVGA